jgi:hypothetical protein
MLQLLKDVMEDHDVDDEYAASWPYDFELSFTRHCYGT